MRVSKERVSGAFGRLLIGSLLVAFAVSACTPSIDGRPLDELAAEGGEGQDYVVKSGDSLSVEVCGEPKLSGEVFVRDDGKFTMPLINDVPASGKTLQQVSTEITRQLNA
ncbi:MAG: polysaccharide biosynthesis/export family protein, partial [Bdellovibrionales bacterium]|nr:polysaccharide biosynthesis/export family protein [Bdellovibrionales bacterium]